MFILMLTDDYVDVLTLFERRYSQQHIQEVLQNAYLLTFCLMFYWDKGASLCSVVQKLLHTLRHLHPLSGYYGEMIVVSFGLITFSNI